jgi:Domain of unknown function (DUF4440)
MTLAELVARERDGWQSLVDGTAAAFYRDALTNDALLVVPGMVIDGSTWVESLQGAQWSHFELSDARILELTGDCAALVYRAEARREGEPTYAALITSIYRREGDTWKLALHQQTPEPG